MGEIEGKMQGYSEEAVTNLGRPLLFTMVVLCGEIKGMGMVAMEISLGVELEVDFEVEDRGMGLRKVTGRVLVETFTDFSLF